MNMKDEQKARELLVEYGKKLLEAGLVQGTWGNLSIRLSDEYMMVTPSGLDYTRVTPEDMVKINIESLEYDGINKPTSEKTLHAAVYKLRPDAGAVIHTHSKFCSIFAAAGMPMQVEDPELIQVLGELINVADYALPGTKGLKNNTVRALGQRPGCIMSNHGMLCCGVDIEDALAKCGAMEKAAEDYIEKRY